MYIYNDLKNLRTTLDRIRFLRVSGANTQCYFVVVPCDDAGAHCDWKHQKTYCGLAFNPQDINEIRHIMQNGAKYDALTSQL